MHFRFGLTRYIEENTNNQYEIVNYEIAIGWEYQMKERGTVQIKQIFVT